MPTLDYIDGFEHRVVEVGDATSNLWQNANRPAGLSSVAGRLGGYAIQMVSDGITFTSLRHDIPASNQRVWAGWFQVPSSPSVDSDILRFADSANAVMARFNVRSSDGAIQGCAGTGAFQTGPVVADAAWHRLTLWLDTSGTTWRLHWEVDDVAQTDATQSGKVNTNSARSQFGALTNAHTGTVVWDDVTASITTADHPLPAMHVEGLVPVADGTHNAGTNVIEDNAGTDIGVAVAYSLVDEFPANTTDYIRQVAISTGSYAEVLFDSVSDPSSVVDVAWYGALFSSSTASDIAAFHFVDSTNDQLVSTTNHGFTAVRHVLGAPIPDPAAGWATDVNTLRGRWGYSSDATPNPRISAWLLMAAVLDVTATVVDVDVPGALTLAGATDIVLVTAGGTTVDVDVPGAVQLAGQTVGLTTSIASGAGAVQLVGQQVGLRTSVAAAPGAAQLSGQTVGLRTSVAAGPGALQIAGATDVALSVTGSTATNVDTPGQVSLVGQQVGLRTSVAAAPGAVSLVGQTVGLRASVSAAPGAAQLAGQVVGLRVSVAPTAGAITLSGATDIVLGGTTGTTVSVTVPGAVQLAGQTVGLRTVIASGAAAAQLQGQTVALVRTVTPVAGALQLAGSTVALKLVQTADGGAVRLSGGTVFVTGEVIVLPSVETAANAAGSDRSSSGIGTDAGSTGVTADASSNAAGPS